MKVKKLIGKTINGFTILDTYPAISQNGNQTRKVKLKCEDCGDVFERCSGVDFDHIKCKCKCEYLKPRKQKFHFIDWQGKRYTQTDFCKMHDIAPPKHFDAGLREGCPSRMPSKKNLNALVRFAERNLKTKGQTKKFVLKLVLIEE